MAKTTINKKIDIFLSNSFGFGGTNSALVIKKFKKTMNKEDIIKKIITFLVDEFEVDEEDIQPDAILKDTLGLDSLDYVDLVVSVEANFGVKLVKPILLALLLFKVSMILSTIKLNLKQPNAKMGRQITWNSSRL